MPKIPRYHFYRRLHSLSGIFPLGFFLIWHLLANSISLSSDGVTLFNQYIESKSKVPFYLLIEIIFVYLPLLFHAGFGLVLFANSKNNITTYLHGSNVRFFLQRVTGFFALFFIFFHAYETRIETLRLGVEVDYLWMVKVFEHPVKFWIYFFGILMINFHFFQGLWASLISWGMTTSRRSQKVSFIILSILFLVLTFLSLLMILNYTYHYQDAPLMIGKILSWVKEYLFR